MSYPCDFRVGVHDAGDCVIIYVAVALCDEFDCRDGLFFSLVCEHGTESAVTDDADVRQFSAVLFVDDETAFVVNIKVDVFKTKAGGIGTAADGDEDDVCIKLEERG